MFAALVLAGSLQAAPVQPTPAACTADASVVTTVEPVLPRYIYESLDREHDAVVAVTIDAAGQVSAATIATSTGNQLLDYAALQAAKHSKFKPAIAGCKPITSTVGYDVSFEPARPCTMAFHDATVLNEVPPQPPDFPAPGLLNVSIRVTIGPDGSLQEARIESSSGLLPFDQAALQAAKATTYLPKTVKCKAVAGTYLFKVTFARYNKT